ncbi:MAG: hypothetical protein HY226_01940 [Candidatus Vogelbacteria bacterium]|nr:hypothetical protein [Candidatus Vogelbacteria bacterium]
MMEKMPKIDNSGPLTGEYYLVPGCPGQSIPTPLDRLSPRLKKDVILQKLRDELNALADRIIAKYPTISKTPTHASGPGLQVTIPANLDVKEISREFDCIFMPVRDVAICPRPC